jgi:excisionase family DNA binding protein
MTRSYQATQPNYLLSSEAAAILQVSPKTVSRWAKEGRLPFMRTLGNHRRYEEQAIRALLAANTIPAERR